MERLASAFHLFQKRGCSSFDMCSFFSGRTAPPERNLIAFGGAAVWAQKVPTAEVASLLNHLVDDSKQGRRIY